LNETAKVRARGKSKACRFFIVAAAALFLFLSNASSAQAAVVHQVKAGESLYSISRKYNTTITALRDLNRLSSNLIYPGQVLTIPLVYQVRPGESWYLIAQKFGVSVARLKTVNEQKSDLLLAGQKISIPVAASSGTSSPSRGYISYSREEATLLARLINGEARGEPYIGQVAVGAVVLNRVKSSLFPNTISAVIFQAGAFTAVQDGQIWLNPTDSALKAAADALGGWDPTGGALYYYNPATATNNWIRTRTIVARIGNHVFAV